MARREMLNDIKKIRAAEKQAEAIKKEVAQEAKQIMATAYQEAEVLKNSAQQNAYQKAEAVKERLKAEATEEAVRIEERAGKDREEIAALVARNEHAAVVFVIAELVSTIKEP